MTSIRMKGIWRLVFRDAKTGEVIKVIEKENVLTSSAKNYAAQAYGYMFGQSGNRYNWCIMLGTGYGTPTASDTSLFQPVTSTAKKGTVTVTDNAVQFYVRYEPNEANGYTYTEAGLYDGIAKWSGFDPTADYALGNLVSHLMFSEPQAKDESAALDVYVTITFV